MSDQKPDEQNDSPSVYDLVIEDMLRKKHDTQPEDDNGRNPLKDAYEKMLDHLVYLKQAMIERDAFMEEFGTEIHRKMEEFTVIGDPVALSATELSKMLDTPGIQITFTKDNPHSPYPVTPEEVRDSPEYKAAYDQAKEEFFKEELLKAQEKNNRGESFLKSLTDAIRKRG